tara:strand:- start:616 stop:1278 length:663 start_codon:yes stop_codon:yes gene_type:complete
MKICFIAKKEKIGVKEAINYSKKLSSKIDVFYGSPDDPFPEKIIQNKYDILVSYLSPWIIPAKILKKTTKWNLNFHPGPPKYPGIGCFNFAIFNSAKEFGATAHIMKPKVDTGKIIGVEYFSINSNKETVETLSVKTYQALLTIYRKVVDHIIKSGKLPNCNEKWKRKPYKRIELEKLATIKPNMSKSEIDTIIRSTYYKNKPAPFIELHGYKFEYNPER